MDRTLFWALGMAAALDSAPASAQQAPATSAAFVLAAAKSEAILGSPSRLAALVAQQSGVAQPAARYVTVPGSNSRPLFAAPMPYLRPALSSDRPDVFGTVALPVGRTPLDGRWHRVQRQGIGGAPADYAASLRDRSPAERLEAVNRYVNSRVNFVDDIRQYRRADVWQAASVTLRRGRGDCEDYAIAKLQMLRVAGFAQSDLYLVIVKDLVRRADHAVLVARADGHMLLLDNGTNRITDATAYQDYRPVLSYSASRAWTHGYARTQPMNVATAPAAIAPVATLASAAL